MSNYTPITDFAAKDTLVTGNPSKIIKGTDVSNELEAIATAITSKSDSSSPTFSGTLAGTFTIDGGTY
jgi:hypothetical protein